MDSQLARSNALSRQLQRCHQISRLLHDMRTEDAQLLTCIIKARSIGMI